MIIIETIILGTGYIKMTEQFYQAVKKEDRFNGFLIGESSKNIKSKARLYGVESYGKLIKKHIPKPKEE